MSHQSNITVLTTGTIENQAAAAIVKLVYPDAQLLLVNYSKDIKYSQISLNSTVFVIGFSLTVNELKSLSTRYDLVYIIHHEQSVQDVIDAGLTIKGLRSSEAASCILVWKFLNGDAPVPQALQDISDYATWKFITDKNNLPLYLHHALGMCDLISDKAMPFWTKLFKDNELYLSLIEQGKLLDTYITMRDTICANDTAFEITLNGSIRCLVSNSRSANSLLFRSIVEANPGKYDVLITYGWGANINKFRISFYQNNPKIPVDEIARSFGGNGGRGVSGVAMVQLPFKCPVNAKPLIYENLYTECDKLEAANTSIQQYVNKGNRIVLGSSSFDVLLQGKLIIGMNYERMTHQIFTAANNLFTYDATMTFVQTNSGLYRMLIKPLSVDRRVIAEFEALLPAMFKCSAELIKRVDIRGEIYFMHYCERLPFKIPFQEENN